MVLEDLLKYVDEYQIINLWYEDGGAHNDGLLDVVYISKTLIPSKYRKLKVIFIGSNIVNDKHYMNTDVLFIEVEHGKKKVQQA